MKNIILYFFSMLQLISCAQTKDISHHTLGTYTVQMPGNIAVDPSGKELSPQRPVSAIVYFETESGDVSFKNAVIHDVTYKITAEPVLQFPFSAGINFNTNENIMVTANKNNFLWKLIIEPFVLPDSQHMVIDTLLIQGKYKGQPFQQSIIDWKKIENIPTY